MPTTTTYAAIRDAYYTVIEALTPAVLPALRFRRQPRHLRLEDWAARAGSAALRHFSLERDALVSDPLVMDPSTVERNETCTLLVAYPADPALYGRDDRDDMESVLRRDARQLRDAIFSAGNYQAGQSAAFVTLEPTRREGNVWFLPLRIDLIYTEAQSLT